MKLRTLVIDDEELPRQRVRELVQAHPRLSFTGDAGDGARALDLIVAERPDLVFLDIQMPELDGFQVVNALEDDVMPAVVFVTAYDEYAVRAFEVDAVDYLLKPVTQQRFEAAVARVLGRVRAPDDATQLRTLAARLLDARGTVTRFAARRGGKHYFVRVADVHCIEAEGNYLRLTTATGTHMVRDTMKDVERRLDAAHFVRIHRSCIVAIDRIRTIETTAAGEYLITMDSGRRLPGSRSYGERIRALLRT